MPDFGSIPADRNPSGLGSTFASTTSARFIGTPHAIRSSAAVTLNRLYCQPVYVPTTTTFDRISFELTTSFAATGVARLGIYNNSSSTVDLPGTLLLDAGTVDDTVAAARLDITINQQLTPGLYWLGFVQQTTATTGTVRHGTWPVFSMPTSAPEGSSPTLWPYMSSVSGALGTFTISAFGATCPLVWLRQA